MSKQDIPILQFIAEGLNSKEIGKKLNLSPRTIERHIELLKAKFDAKNITNLIHIAHKEKLLK